MLPKGPADGLRPVRLPKTRAPKRIPWHDVPLSLRQEVERFCDWSSLPDPLAENARARALAPRTLILMRCHLHSAVSAAVAAGIPLAEISSLAKLVEPDVVRALLRQRWREDGSKLTTYTCGALASLVAVAKDWVKVSAETLAALKALRSKLGTLPSGMTEKNKALLRHFNDPRLTQDLIDLPNKLWQASRRALANGRKYSFIDLQSALAIDLLLVKPLRMENLAPLDFKKHISWPQGRGKPALICIGGDGTKNGEESVFEIPTALAERFLIYRNEIAPAVIGVRPDASVRHPRQQAKNAGSAADRDLEDGAAAPRHKNDAASVSPFRREASPRRQSECARSGRAVARSQKLALDQKILRGN